MEINLFNNIQEFNPVLVFNQYSENKHEINLNECKLAFYFIFGMKIKKKIIFKLLHNKNINFEYEIKNNYIINLDEFVLAYNYIKNEESKNIVSNHNLILTLYNYLSEINTNKNGITLNCFKDKIKENFPFLTSSYIEDIFFNLDTDKDGRIFINDIENIFYKIQI